MLGPHVLILGVPRKDLFISLFFFVCIPEETNSRNTCNVNTACTLPKKKREIRHRATRSPISVGNPMYRIDVESILRWSGHVRDPHFH